jgi:hypothetical protein
MTGKPCSIEDCDSPAIARGWCAKHYGRWQRQGDPLVTKRYDPRPDRLSDRVQRWQATGLAVCVHHGDHSEWQFYTKGKPGRAGFYRALNCKICVRERTRQYIQKNPDLVRTKMLTLHSRAVRACLAARHRAEKMGWDFDLTVEWIEEQHERQGGRCAYTGHEFDHTDMRKAPDSMSLDRVDPTRGYTTDNVLLVGWRVNFAKLDMTLDEFRSLCRDVVNTIG